MVKMIAKCCVLQHKQSCQFATLCRGKVIEDLPIFDKDAP